MELLLQKELLKSYSRLSFDFFDGKTDIECPYGTFGYCRSIDNDTKTTHGQVIFLQLDLFSQYNGLKEIQSMIKELKEMTPQFFIIEGIVVDLTDMTVSIQKELDEERLTYHGIIELTFTYY